MTTAAVLITHYLAGKQDIYTITNSTLVYTLDVPVEAAAKLTEAGIIVKMTDNGI